MTGGAEPPKQSASPLRPQAHEELQKALTHPADHRIVKRDADGKPVAGAQVYHGGTYKGGAPDGVVYFAHHPGVTQSYAEATKRRLGLRGQPADDVGVREFHLPHDAKIGTHRDVYNAAKNSGSLWQSLGSPRSGASLRSHTFWTRTGWGAEGVKRLTDLLTEQGLHGAHLDDHTEEGRPHAAIAYWGKAPPTGAGAP